MTGGVATLADDDYISGTISNLELPSDCENNSLFYLRWIMLSNDSVSHGESVKSTGTSRIDNIIVYGEAITSDLTQLNTAITAAQAKHDTAVEGIEPNNYAVGSKAIFLTAIDTARTITASSAQSVVDAAVVALAAADAAFEAGRVLSPDTHEDTATNAVVKAETTPTQANVDSAQDLVDLLTEGDLKTDLQARLDAAQDIVDANVIAAGLVSDLITALPALGDLTLANTSVGEARVAYNALIPEGKVLVLNYSTLTSAEAQLAALQAATDAVAALETASRLGSRENLC